jgi:hypothetical protein
MLADDRFNIYYFSARKKIAIQLISGAELFLHIRAGLLILAFPNLIDCGGNFLEFDGGSLGCRIFLAS